MSPALLLLMYTKAIALVLLMSISSMAHAAPTTPALDISSSSSFSSYDKLMKLETSSRRLKIAGGVTLGLGFLVQGVGIFMAISLSDFLSNSNSKSGTALWRAGFALGTLGSLAIPIGAIMHGVGAGQGRAANRMRRSLELMPSVSLMPRSDGRSLAGATVQWNLRF